MNSLIQSTLRNKYFIVHKSFYFSRDNSWIYAADLFVNKKYLSIIFDSYEEAENLLKKWAEIHSEEWSKIVMETLTS